MWYPPFLRSLIFSRYNVSHTGEPAVIAKSCYRKVGYSVCTALWKRQVGIYTADLRFVYQVNKKQEFPADRWKMKISWKPLLKCMWCAILKAQWKHWYTKLERCVLYIFPVIGRVVLAGTALSVLGVFLFTLLYNTFTLLSIKFGWDIVCRFNKNVCEYLCVFIV